MQFSKQKSLFASLLAHSLVQQNDVASNVVNKTNCFIFEGEKIQSNEMVEMWERDERDIQYRNGAFSNYVKTLSLSLLCTVLSISFMHTILSISFVILSFYLRRAHVSPSPSCIVPKMTHCPRLIILVCHSEQFKSCRDFQYMYIQDKKL